jgi:hypothetical protein
MVQQSRLAHHNAHLENTRNIGIIAHVDAVCFGSASSDARFIDDSRAKPPPRSGCSITVA